LDKEKQRKIATTSGSAVVVVGILAFFFANERTAHLPIEAQLIATLVIVAVMLVALRRYFAAHKF
jgi:membrane protein implicated in regulation of membrane protease activity